MWKYTELRLYYSVGGNVARNAANQQTNEGGISFIVHNSWTSILYKLIESMEERWEVVLKQVKIFLIPPCLTHMPHIWGIISPKSILTEITLIHIRIQYPITLLKFAVLITMGKLQKTRKYQIIIRSVNGQFRKNEYGTGQNLQNAERSEITHAITLTSTRRIMTSGILLRCTAVMENTKTSRLLPNSSTPTQMGKVN